MTTPTGFWGSIAADPLLERFSQAGVIEAADIQLARHLSHLYGETEPLVALATALVVAALRSGSVGLELAQAATMLAVGVEPTTDDSATTEPAVPLPWPDYDQWLAHLAASRMVAQGSGESLCPLRLVDGLLYLESSWQEQEQVAQAISDRLVSPPAGQPPVGTAESPSETTAPPPPVMLRAVAASTTGPQEETVSPEPDASLPQLPSPTTTQDLPQLAAQLVRSQRFFVLGGGPGTGKTTTIAQLLVALADGGRPPRIYLAAPTGKAAARLDAAVRQNLNLSGHTGLAQAIPTAATIHRLLGIKPWGSVDYHRRHPLPADVVVVDEVSMLSLHQMALLLDAIPDSSRAILVGDPDQLASVESGAVLADLVAAAETSGAIPFVRLEHNYRFGGAIGELARAIRLGDSGRVLELLQAGDPAVQFSALDPSGHRPATSLGQLPTVIEATARDSLAAIGRGDWEAALAAANRHRLLCAHRLGAWGVARWGQWAESWLSQELPGYAATHPWYPGLPVQVTKNDEVLKVYNGDAGVVVPLGSQLRVALPGGDGLRLIGPAELDGLEPIHATTIHKAQGSQYAHVSIVVPPAATALLTRELLYTAVTRAESSVHLLGTPEAVAYAVEHRARRASGLARSLSRRL